MALSLDHYTLTPASSTVAPQPNTPQEIDAHLHNIRSAAGARNRWFDKSFTLIVESNTRAGAMGEHSPCDALVPSIVCEYALVQGVDWNTTSSPLFNKNVEPGYWTRLDWVTDDYIEHECIEAEKRANQVIQESDDSVLLFQEYGADWIKDGACSFIPDRVGY